jgi:hypothetical protein
VAAQAFCQPSGHTRNGQHVDQFPGGPGQQLMADGRHPQTQEHPGPARFAAGGFQHKRPGQAGATALGPVDQRGRRGDQGNLEGFVAAPVIGYDVTGFQPQPGGVQRSSSAP